MHARRLAFAVTAVLAAVAAGCTPSPGGARWAEVTEATPPFLAAEPAFDPALAAAPGGRVALTFVTRDTNGADVWVALSSDSGAHFAAAERINLRRGKVSSYPESRAVALLGEHGRIVIAWAAARDSGRFADDVVTRTSDDGGASFGPETPLNDDRALPGSAYHGFVALDATASGRIVAAWIDGRSTALAAGESEPGVAEIWGATSDDGGVTWSANRRFAAGVCPCCRPSLRAGATRIALAYRGVRDSLRDPRLAISHDGGVTFENDSLFSADGWALSGCPSSGPAVTLSRDGGWFAWYTGAPGREGVHAAPWRDGSAVVAAPFTLDDSLRECAHPMLAGMGPVALAGVLARTGAARRVLALRTLGAAGERSPWLLLGANARSAAIAGQDSRHALAAWVEQSDAGPRVRVVRVTRR
jgi:hypothetical protein